jgi:hypothetical protein
VAMSMEELAAVVCAQGEPVRSARLYGAAEALRQAIGAPRPPADAARYERSITAVRAQLNEDSFAAAWVEGCAMTPEEAVGHALQLGSTPWSDTERGQRATIAGFPPRGL